jgi:hypothetical protein
VRKKDAEKRLKRKLVRELKNDMRQQLLEVAKDAQLDEETR